MSPERIVRRSMQFIDYITPQANYNFVPLRSSSLTHNPSDEGETPRTAPRGRLLKRL